MISRAVAALADSALLLPASALLAAYLLAVRELRLAAAFSLSLAIAGSATMAAKLLFHACGATITDADVVSPSGHASFAVIFYGAVAVLLGSGRAVAVKAALATLFALLIVGVSISRVRTGAHTAEEVGIGVLIGAVALALFASMHARLGRPRLAWAPVVLGFAAAVLLLGGLHFSLEHRIAQAARRLSSSLDVCAPPERGTQLRFLLRL